MASTTSDSLPSSPSLPAADQELEFSSHHRSLFLPASSSSPASLYLDSSFHGLLPPASSAAAMSSSSSPPPPLPPQPPAPPSKPAKKRPRASRRPPTTVLTTDTSNFRAMVQEFTGFPAPPFAAAPPPAVRPRLLAGVPPFLMRPSPLKYPHSSPLLMPPGATCTATPAGGGNSSSMATGTSSLVDALALFSKSNETTMPGVGAAATTSGGGSSAPDHYHHGIGMVGFNPFDDFVDAPAPEGDRLNAGAAHGFFSSFSAGDKYGRH